MSKQMTRTIIFGLATALLISFFYFFIPIDTLHSSPVFFAFLGSISITIFAVLFLIGVLSFFDKIDENGKAEPSSFSGYLILIILFVSLFGNGASIIWTEIKRTNIELDKNGVIVMSKIIDGDSFSGRNFDLSNISVSFIDRNEVEHKLNVSVSKYDFEKFYLSQEIPLVYSTKYMSINKVIHNDDEFLKYPKQR